MYYKFQQATQNTPFDSLHVSTQNFLQEKALTYRLSFSEIKNLIEIAIDLQMWNENTLQEIWVDVSDKKKTLLHVSHIYQDLRDKPKRYAQEKPQHKMHKISLEHIQKPSLGIGSCPVASPKTRCCNLMTLDAVESCGFDCSYCSIQSFYHENKVVFDTDFAHKLANLELDANKTYHIGTGQSSDSLLWGNKGGILEALFSFATSHSNVILELKSKSNNIAYLLEHEVPKNVLVTFSLNPQIIITNEEHGSASLHERITAARALADKGILVGFHFHPMVVFENSINEYAKIAKELIKRFTCNEVALVSMGTLTFIKPVLKKLRKRAIHSKILQMPLSNANGKFSYPLEQKKQMFQTLYAAFSPWHTQVFFYLCMEDASLWKSVFNYEYASNEAFEQAMLAAYMQKIEYAKSF
ncbi:MAG: hypothetical protein IBX44_08650 [Sulfurospirillum sp.]|nr:hypothetical protein [Sulfurospirillum sp.]